MNKTTNCVRHIVCYLEITEHFVVFGFEVIQDR